MTKMDEAVAYIAKRLLNLDTLETRKSDRLDFKEQVVWNIKEALVAAYTAGCQSRNIKRQGLVKKRKSL